MIAAILKSNWPAPFSRTIRDPNGKPLKTMTFTQGCPVELTEDEAKALAPDIGKALTYPQLDASGKPTGKPIRDDSELEAKPLPKEDEPKGRRRGR